ncbi:MAG: FadR family transcriptional regulator [Ardenticatenaceae bacterium]|nr:FadR family transcriptional regulator [Ardenticatenaceae bacterium]
MTRTNSNSEVRLASIRTPRAADLVVAHIRHKIISREYAEGTRLPTETEMADQLNISRPTVREALRILEAEGLIVTRPGPGGGPRVCSPDVKTVMHSLTNLFQYERVTLAELLEARETLEAASARRAAMQATAEDIDALRQSIERMRAGLKDDDVFWTENANFHQSLGAASGNKVLYTMMTALRELIYRSTAGLSGNDQGRTETLAEHTAILGAIEARDPEGAAAAVRVHLLNSERRLNEENPQLLQLTGLSEADPLLRIATDFAVSSAPAD